MPGMMPAMNSAPTDVFVATAYITMTIDGGMRMPSAPDVVITPAPKRAGKPCRTIAGRMIEPIATTVAGELPDTAAKSAQAITPARPRPPYQCPIIAEAKLIMRRATPPCVRKLPARMKNGIAMISNFSMPVKSLSATDSIGTVVIANRYVSTVRPSEMEIGMPVSIRPTRRAKMIHGLATGTPASFSPTGMPMARIGISPGQRAVLGCEAGAMRQLAGAPEAPRNLQEAEAHQVRAERDAEVHDPLRQLEVRRHRIGVRDVPRERCAERADDAGEERAREQAEQHVRLARAGRQAVDHHVDADVDASAHAVRGAELRHPHEHVDAQLLRPGEIELEQRVLEAGNCQSGRVTMRHRHEDQQRRRAHEERDKPFLEMIEQLQHVASPLARTAATSLLTRVSMRRGR